MKKNILKTDTPQKGYCYEEDEKTAGCIRRLFPWSLAMAMTFALLCGMGITASAAADSPSLDWTWDGKSSITVELEDENDNVVYDGVLTLYQVALLEQDNGDMVYTFTSAFSGCGVSLDDVSSDSTALASKLSDYVTARSITGTSVNNTNGTVVFDNLQLGLYLIVQTVESNGYYTLNPFVVSVPLAVDDNWVYTVDASPKVGVLAPVPEEPEPETPAEETSEPETPGEEAAPMTDAITEFTVLPQTGQLNWPVYVLAVCGLFLIVLGSVLVCGDRRKASAR
ncbi:MAG: hypothetical protein LUG61_12940 [Lachnospiraceae bacterium]|nr:hypothetical protein [Lachnospiraceae bacterium]